MYTSMCFFIRIFNSHSTTHGTTSEILQVPEFRVAYSINTDALDALYKRLKPKGVTMSGLLAKAAGVALSKHPTLYAGLLLLPALAAAFAPLYCITLLTV